MFGSMKSSHHHLIDEHDRIITRMLPFPWNLGCMKCTSYFWFHCRDKLRPRKLRVPPCSWGSRQPAPCVHCGPKARTHIPTSPWDGGRIPSAPCALLSHGFPVKKRGKWNDKARKPQRTEQASRTEPITPASSSGFTAGHRVQLRTLQIGSSATLGR